MYHKVGPCTILQGPTLWYTSNMAIRKTPLINNEYYHIYNRGNGKQIIFHDDEDKERFIKLLGLLNQQFRVRTDDFNLKDYLKNKEQIVSIGAYVLMDNHFHILIKQTSEKGITFFMRKVCTGYVMYYNKKYKRSGGLFEGKFKSKIINEDVYMKYLFSYIHLNPLKLVDKEWKLKGIRNKKFLEFLKNYKYSSFQDFLEIKRPENKLLVLEEFPEYFPSARSFLREIQSWFNLQGPTL